MKIDIGKSYKLDNGNTATVKGIAKKGRGHTVQFAVRGQGKNLSTLSLAKFEKAAGL